MNQTFLSFVLGFFGIILTSFGLTVLLDSYDATTPTDDQSASVFQAMVTDLTR